MPQTTYTQDEVDKIIFKERGHALKRQEIIDMKDEVEDIHRRLNEAQQQLITIRLRLQKTRAAKLFIDDNEDVQYEVCIYKYITEGCMKEKKLVERIALTDEDMSFPV